MNFVGFYNKSLGYTTEDSVIQFEGSAKNQMYPLYAPNVIYKYFLKIRVLKFKLKNHVKYKYLRCK